MKSWMPKREGCPPREPMYWTGYIYRLWHYLTGETSRDIYAIADADTMGGAYLGMHVLDPQLAIENLKELAKR